MHRLFLFVLVFAALPLRAATSTFANFGTSTPVSTDYIVGYRPPMGSGAEKRFTLSQLDTYFSSSFQGIDSDLTSWAAVSRASGFDTFVATPSGANFASLLTTALPASKGGTGLTSLSANVVSLLGAADYSAMRTQLGLVISTDVQPFNADLTALAALSGTNTIYYRSASNTWSAVTIGSNLTFSGGTLSASGGGGGLASTDIDTSAELRAIVTDETGTGALVFANTPALVTPDIGAATGTSLALTGNISGNVITANALTITDLTTTNLTISGTITGTMGVANGGTGRTSLTDNNIITGNGTGAVKLIAPATSGYALMSNGTVWAGAAITQANITGLTTADSPQFTAINLGHATDTTITRPSAGDIAVEGNRVFRVGGSFAGLPDVWVIPIGDETTAITTGTAKVTFRAPYAATVTGVKATLTTVSSSGTPTFDINEGGTTILSTKLTVDASEKTSTTAATAAVISDSALADDAEITIDVDTAGTSAAGAKIYIYVTR